MRGTFPSCSWSSRCKTGSIALSHLLTFRLPFRGCQAARALGPNLAGGQRETQRAWAEPEIRARMSEVKKRNGRVLPPMTDAERKLYRVLQPSVGREAALAEVLREDKAA
jgi:hypothetical protein